MRPFRSLLAVLGTSAIWPAYLVLVAYAARQSPLPRGMALSSSLVLLVVAIALYVVNLSRALLKARGWGEVVLRIPSAAARQLRRTIILLTVAAVVFILPERVISLGLLAPGGRPLSAPSLCRGLELAFQLVVLFLAYRLTRTTSPLADWILDTEGRLGWWKRHRRFVSWAVTAAIGAVIGLDAGGYTFSARRLQIGACQFLLVAAACSLLYRLVIRAIDHHAWKWIRIGQTRADADGTSSGEPADVAARLRRMAAFAVPALGVLVCAWLWDLNLALFRSLGEQAIVHGGKEGISLTLGDVTEAGLVLLVTSVIWRHLSTLFAIAIFPRMTEDPGVRFAVLTLTRYAVLGIGILTGLSAVHLGPAQIGMVLAALGVGLGFGLQEIVSNFVCGIILLLERPIRVGDIVTVSGMNGKVDRINIRATTIINGDNQSIIVPNRAFITGDLVNWTLKDKVVRAAVKVTAAPGSDPDKVTEILLSIAREDPDVLCNPMPSSLMEDFTEAALAFALYVHVPEPSLAGRVRHRMMCQIQKRFREAGIEIPLPARELVVKAAGRGLVESEVVSEFVRFDRPSAEPRTPHWNATPQPACAVETFERGVDE